MQEFSSHFAGFLWNMLCHSLWSIPLIGLLFGLKLESLSPDQGDRRMRHAIFASLFVPVFIALTFAAFEKKSKSLENAVERNPPLTSSLARKIPALERPITNTVDATQSQAPSLLISLRTAIRNAAPWAIFFWSAGMIVLIARLFLGGIVFRYRIGSCAGHSELQSIVDSLAERLRLRQSPDVRISKSVNQPMLAGMLSPVVILPENWPIEADSDQIEAVLAHELAHVRRCDLRNRLIERMAAIVWFFHPAMHRLNRKAALWREIATDRLAVSTTGKPLALAHALESFAQRTNGMRGHSHFEMTGISLLASQPRNEVLTRVEAVLGIGGSRPMKFDRKTGWAIVAMTAFLAAFAVFLVQARPFSKASMYRTAIPIGGIATMSVGAGNANARNIVYEVRLVNVDTEFADKALRNVVNPPPGQFLPEHLVIGPDVARALASHPSASSLLFPRVTAAERASASCRWESPNQPKIAMIEQFGRPVPEKIRNEKVWTEFRFVGHSSGDGIELQSEITDFNDRLKLSQSPGKVTGPANLKSAPYAVSVTEELHSNGTTKLKPGESLCVRLGASLETYRKEPRFLYERVLGEKGARVAQFVRLAIVTARVANEDAE